MNLKKTGRFLMGKISHCAVEFHCLSPLYPQSECTFNTNGDENCPWYRREDDCEEDPLTCFNTAARLDALLEEMREYLEYIERNKKCLSR